MLGKILICFLISQSVVAAEFQEIMGMLDSHELVSAQLEHANSIAEESRKEGSWGDPMLNVAAVNFPRETLNQDASMMTGIRFGLSQNVSLSGKYGVIQDSLAEMANSQRASGLQLKRNFARSIWEVAAEKERLVKVEAILKENLAWIKSNLKVTKRLYATGKVPQQAVLDIQMRKSQLESDLGNVAFSLKSLTQELGNLLSNESEIELNLKSVPWAYLNKWKKAQADKDYKEKELAHQLKASDLMVSAKNRNYVPDIQVGVNYTKRNNIDGLGDFVGASITIPIPTSSKRYADKSQALLKKVAAEKRYRNYKITKGKILRKVELEILDYENQLSILEKQTLKFAKSSRDVTARSYARGGADYLELLRSELQYQKELVKKVNIESMLKKKKVGYLFLKGDSLLLGSK